MELTVETKLLLSCLYAEALFIYPFKDSGFSNHRGEYSTSKFGIECVQETEKNMYELVVKIMNQNPEIMDYGILLNSDYIKINGSYNNEYTQYGNKQQLMMDFIEKNKKYIDWNKITTNQTYKLQVRPDINNLLLMLNEIHKNVKTPKEEKDTLQQQNDLLHERINVITDELLEVKKQVEKLVCQLKPKQPDDLLNFTGQDRPLNNWVPSLSVPSFNRLKTVL